MKTALVGFSGFVGSNLVGNYKFEKTYNSKNIKDAYGTEPELLVYSGLPSAMYKANSDPESDFSDVLQAIDNIKKIRPQKIVLISTVAVYDNTINVDESYEIDEKELLPYGKNRLFFEKWITLNYSDRLIVRLPALYGMNLKKNFIYDYINVIPSILNEQKYKDLLQKETLIEECYEKKEDNLYYLIAKGEKKKEIYQFFCSSDFNALNFTDSRSIYQFYNLNRLWSDIQIAQSHRIKLLNIVTEPIKVSEVYEYLSGKTFTNILPKTPYRYDIRSCHAKHFGNLDYYFLSKEEVLNDLQEYVDLEKQKIWQ